MPSEEPGKGLTGTPGSQLVAGTILEDGDGNPQLEVLNTVTFENSLWKDETNAARVRH